MAQAVYSKSLFSNSQDDESNDDDVSDDGIEAVWDGFDSTLTNVITPADKSKFVAFNATDIDPTKIKSTRDLELSSIPSGTATSNRSSLPANSNQQQQQQEQRQRQCDHEAVFLSDDSKSMLSFTSSQHTEMMRKYNEKQQEKRKRKRTMIKIALAIVVLIELILAYLLLFTDVMISRGRNNKNKSSSNNENGSGKTTPTTTEILESCGLSSSSTSNSDEAPATPDTNESDNIDEWTMLQMICGNTLRENGGSNVALSADGRTVAILYERANASRIREIRVFRLDESLLTGNGDDNEDEEKPNACPTFNHNNTNDVNGADTPPLFQQLGPVIELPGEATPYLEYPSRRLDISADGNVIVFGSPYIERRDLGVDVFSGRVTVLDYNENDDEWIARPVLHGEPSELFGWAVALSQDGSVVAIGNAGGTTTRPGGWARVFEYTPNDEEWERVGDDILSTFDDSVDSNVWFGYSVALSADGNILAVGAPYTGFVTSGDGGGGTVRVYQRRLTDDDGSTWDQLGNDITEFVGGVGDIYNGFSTALSDNGQTIVISGLPERPQVTSGARGVTHVWQLADDMQGGGGESLWKQVGGTIEGPYRYGLSVDISADGKTIGTSYEIPIPEFTNRVDFGGSEIYQWLPSSTTNVDDEETDNDNEWTMVSPISLSDSTGSEDSQGKVTSVSLSADGRVWAIGQPNARNGDDRGCVTILYHTIQRQEQQEK